MNSRLQNHITARLSLRPPQAESLARLKGTERRFTVILERDADKCFRPVKGQSQIYCKRGAEQPKYIPGCVAETESFILMAETKVRNDLKTDEVKAKSLAAVRWCGCIMKPPRYVHEDADTPRVFCRGGGAVSWADMKILTQAQDKCHA